MTMENNVSKADVDAPKGDAPMVNASKTEGTQKVVWGELSEAAIADAAQLLGTELRRDRMRWVSEATRDAIAHFVEGIGDRNPLYRDPSYGPKTRWGSMIAPPMFLFAIDNTVVAPRLPGLQWIYAGIDWTFYDVVRLGDTIDPVTRFHSQELKTGRFSRQWLLQTGHTQYFRHSDKALLAEAYGRNARTPRGAALKKEGGAKYEKRGPHRYTAEEIADIEAQILAEAPRGAAPRFFEDVEIGEALRPVIKGPLNSNDMVAFYAGTMGARPYGGAHADAVHYRARHADYEVSEQTGVKESPGRGHLEANAGEDIGMGGAYDSGFQRISWGGHLISDWIGDDGFLHKFSATLRRPNLFGDTLWWKGAVAAKRQVDGYGLIDLELRADNQRGEITTEGTATVVLPSREHGPVILPIPKDLGASR